MANFGWGNTKSLQQDTDTDLYDDLRKFFLN